MEQNPHPVSDPLDPEYDILKDEELLRLLELDSDTAQPRTEAHISTEPETPPPQTSGKAARKLPAWCFLLIAGLYHELLLFFGTPVKSFPAFCLILIFTLSWSLGGYALLRLLPKRWMQRVVGGLGLAAGAFVYALEYFLQATFQTFMDFSTVLSSTGQVVGSFGGSVVTIVTRGWWMILLMLLPLLFWSFGCKLISLPPCLYAHGESGKRTRRRWLGTVCAMLTVLLLAQGLVYSTPVLHSAYSERPTAVTFDKHVNSFGLLTAGRLELQNALFRTPVSFVTGPTETQQPSESADADVPTPSESSAPSKPLVEHTMGLDFAALAEQADGDIANIHRYVASLPKGMSNNYTGLFQGKNLIMVCAESFSAEVIDPVRTPTLYRMAHQGIEFTEFYQPAWGGSTSTGEYSLLTGLAPTNGVNSMLDTVGENLYLTMGNQLKRLGYFSRAYHNNSYDYYGRDQTHENFGYEKYIGLGNGLEEGVSATWPESDLEMIDFTFPQYSTNQPFSIYYMSVSGHGDYQKSSNYMSGKNFDVVADLPYSETVRCYLAAQMELEYAMKSLISQLEAAGIADDTVIVLCADHYPYGLEPSNSWGDGGDYLSELYGYEADTLPKQDHNALIIWSGCLEKQEHIVVDTPVYSLDILPTLSNLFGVEYDSRLLIGRDVFSEQEPLVIWPNYSWKTEKGYYSASTGTFMPDAGVKDVGEDYIERINTLVRNRIAFSAAVLDNDYYGILFD